MLQTVSTNWASTLVQPMLEICEGTLTLSTRTVNELGMVEKKQKQKKQGRPKVLSPDLNHRLAIRCARGDAEAWEQRAISLGYGGASAWIRRILNEALKQPAK